MSVPPPDQIRALPVEPEAEVGDFSSLYRATLVPLREYLARFLGDRSEAQDIAQDAYVKTLVAMRARPVEKPRSYLFTTARRLAMNFQLRRRQRMQPTESSKLDGFIAAGEGPVEQVMSAQDQAAFAEAVLVLPAVCQQVLVLRLHHGLSPAQIGVRLGIAESTASNHLTRAMRLVRDQVAAKNSEPDASRAATAACSHRK